LEEVVAAVAIANIDATLHLRGARGSDFVDLLDRLAQTSGARLSIVLHQPAHPDAMVETCRDHTVGLSTEQPAVTNHDVCVSNKMLTYLAAGMAIVATATKGHQYMVDQAPGAITAYTAGDTRALAGVLRHWDRDRASVAHARRASWQAAASRFHWEHPLERGALMHAYERALA
jgi:hypothetical protein